MSLDFILKIFLFLGQEYFLIPLIVIGYFSPYRNKFYRAFLILLFTIIFNTYLKSIWQIPLAPEINSESFAFPSGHMQNAVSFWLWLSLEFNIIWLYLFALFLLFGIGFGLIHFGYHNLYDVLAAVGFSLLSLICYALIIKLLQISLSSRTSNRSRNSTASNNVSRRSSNNISRGHLNISRRAAKNEFYLNIYLGGIVLFFSVFFIYFNTFLRPHVWLALGAMIGLILGSYFEFQENTIPTFKTRIIKIIIALIGLSLVYVFYYYAIKPYVYTKIHNQALGKALINFTEYFLIGIWVSHGVSVLYKYIKLLRLSEGYFKIFKHSTNLEK